MRRTALVIVMVAVVIAAVVMASPFTEGPGGGSDIGVVAVGGEERGGAAPDLA